MSYDINFWKQARGMKLSAEDIYYKLCDGDCVDGLAELPIGAIHSRLQAEFPGFDPKDEPSFIEGKECGIEVSFSPQHVRFDLRGNVPPAVQKLTEIMSEFGCPMYDPQMNRRFDSHGGTRVKKPPFSAQQSEQDRNDVREERIRQARETLQQIETERSSKSVDELTGEEAYLIGLEQRFWLGDLDAYETHLTDQAYMVYSGPLGVLGRQQVLGAVKMMASLGIGRCTAVTITDIRIVLPATELTLVTYHADAEFGEGEAPAGSIATSMYLRENGCWKLAFRQQSPDLGQ